jgi:hypothetical protein
VAARSEAWNIFVRSNAGIGASNLIQVVNLFCVLVAVLRRVDPPSKESYWLCIGLSEKAAKLQQKDCRAIRVVIKLDKFDGIITRLNKDISNLQWRCFMMGENH